MKICIKCKTEKQLIDFHRNHKMKDGRKGKCKTCCRADSKAYVQTESGKKVRQRSRRTWRSKHPERRKAHKLVENAIKRGELEKSDYCELCAKDKQLNGHHHNYNWPLLVTWTCVDCHKLVHRKAA